VQPPGSGSTHSDSAHGTPVPDWGSVTVVDADPVRADVLSTALFVMAESRLSWAADHPRRVLVIQVHTAR
jgi:thiamine biosynthesis lipoprotein ApbE